MTTISSLLTTITGDQFNCSLACMVSAIHRPGHCSVCTSVVMWWLMQPARPASTSSKAKQWTQVAFAWLTSIEQSQPSRYSYLVMGHTELILTPQQHSYSTYSKLGAERTKPLLLLLFCTYTSPIILIFNQPSAASQLPSSSSQH